MLEIVWPDTKFLAVAYVAGLVLLGAAFAALPKQFRLDGAASWMIVLLLGPLPVLVGVPLASAVALSPYAALPPAALSGLVGLLWVHFVLPALAPDFQTDSFVSSCIPSFLIAAAVFVGGVGANTWTEGYGLGSTDDQNVFMDRSAGTDLYNSQKAPGE
jgi:hypothetical protein